jgi:hypothetical protein
MTEEPTIQTTKRDPSDRNQKYSIDRHHPPPQRRDRSGHRTWTHTPLPRDMRMLLRFQRPPRPTDQVFKLWRRTSDRCPMRASDLSASASAVSRPCRSRAWRCAAVTSGSMNIHTAPVPCVVPLDIGPTCAPSGWPRRPNRPSRTGDARCRPPCVRLRLPSIA